MSNSKYKKLVSESVINELYKKREDTISTRTLEEKEEMKELIEQSKKGYEGILTAIDNVPDAFVETRKFIQDSVDLQIENINLISAYDNEKCYKIGFCDGVNMIIECLNRK